MTGQPAAGSGGDTIFAVASGAGRAAIAVIRLSGPSSGLILSTLCGSLPVARRASLRSLRDPTGALLDRALVLWLPGPGSYTGEDSVELHLHGGRAVTQAVFRALLAAGARPADAGEFSRRAFLAGRMSLLEAEAIGDLATAETETQRMQALHRIAGGGGELVADWARRVTQCLAYCEALIDFPDESLPGRLEEEISDEIGRLVSEIAVHLGRAPAGEAVRNGLVFAISGSPNVGKSSLFNALVGREMAIVSATPGTTRDMLEARLDLGGVAVTFVDTAGLRHTDDPVEAEGVRRAKAKADEADLILLLKEAGQPACEHAPGGNTIVITNKTDLATEPPGTNGISVHTGEGLDALIRRLTAEAHRLVQAEDIPLLSQARHIAALRDARDHMQAALLSELTELRAEDLRVALAAIGRLSGAVDTEAVLDVVFGAFCIGK